MSNQPYSEQLRIAREKARDLKHYAKCLRGDMMAEKARKMVALDVGVFAAKIQIEASDWWQTAIKKVRQAEKERDIAVDEVSYLKNLLEDAREHDWNRRAEMRL